MGRGRGVCAMYIIPSSLFSASLGVLLLGSGWIWDSLPLCFSPPPPARFSGERHDILLRPATTFVSFLPNKATISNPKLPVICFSPLSYGWPSSCHNRCGGSSTVSWPKPVMEAIGKTLRQASRPCCSSNMADLGGFSRLDPAVGSWESLLVWGSSTCIQNLMKKRKFGGLQIVGCCPSSGLQVLCCLVIVSFSGKFSDLNLFKMCSSQCAWMYYGSCMFESKSHMVLRSSFPEILVGQCIFVSFILKLSSRGVKCINSECIFGILETRNVDELAEDGGFRSFGLIHRWQVREPLLLIPRCYERKKIRLGSVLRTQDLQLDRSLPLVHKPTRLLGELPALALKRPLKASAVAACQISLI